MVADREGLIYAVETCDEVRTEAIRGLITLAIAELEVRFIYLDLLLRLGTVIVTCHFSAFRCGLTIRMVTFISCAVDWFSCSVCCDCGMSLVLRHFC